MTNSTFTHLECTYCNNTFTKEMLNNVCLNCEKPLFAHYDLEKASSSLTKEILSTRDSSMWRYNEVLPVEYEENVISLGEGWTPFVHSKRLGAELGFKNLYLKDESLNPTGSFKARGMSAAISQAKEKGVEKIALPTAGNAGGAAAAYSAKAGVEAFIFMPNDTPVAFQVECEQHGAIVEKVNGLISDCGKIVAERKEVEGWFDISTLKEPFRVEGKKTMGYELAEQLDWILPDVIIYPTGGGTGLIGMWKAFDEMETMGWIGSERPRMMAVQAEGCAPIVNAFQQDLDHAEMVNNAHTVASGLRVPGAIGDFLMLNAIKDSNGYALAVSDEELLDRVKLLGRTEGIFAAPEAGTTIAALTKLLEKDLIDVDERIVLFITGGGAKYVDVFN